MTYCVTLSLLNLTRLNDKISLISRIVSADVRIHIKHKINEVQKRGKLGITCVSAPKNILKSAKNAEN